MTFIKKDPLYIQSIGRTFHLLQAFTKGEPKLTLAELTNKTDMLKSTVQRIVHTLEVEGYLKKDELDKSYRLDMNFFQLGSIAMTGTGVSDVAKPYLKTLRDQSGESTFLNIVVENERMCIEFFQSSHEIQMLVFTGQRSPLYAGASAKALLAFLPDEEIKYILNNVAMNKITKQTLTKSDEIWEEISQIRKQGYAISNQERVIGAFSISYPIFDVNKIVVASISITIPTVRLDNKNIPKYIELISEKANNISEEMGYDP